MDSERRQGKIWRKSTAAGAVILAAVGLATVSKDFLDDRNAHDQTAKFLPVPPFAYNQVPSSETQYIERDFKKFLTTWTRQNPSMKNVSLDLILSGTTTCKSNLFRTNVINSNDINGMVFCAPENKVVVTRAGINLINELSVPNANTWKGVNATPADFRPQVEHQLIDLMVAHELGHAVQFETTGELNPKDMHTELQADCYAGQAYRDNGLMASYYDTENLYELFNPIPDPTHGTAAQRSASFERGITGAECPS